MNASAIIVNNKTSLLQSSHTGFQILHFLGIEGPKTADPSKFIRYVYNRVHLENATVRASAVSTLAKFGALVDTLKVLLVTTMLNSSISFSVSCDNISLHCY